MKLKAQIYQPQKDSVALQLPPILDNLRELFIPDAIKWLRIFGIAKTTIKPITIGIRTVNDVSCRTMPEALPEPMRNLQKSVAKQVAELMLSFGVTELELLPTEDELVQMRQFWSTVVAKPLSDTPVKANTLPLNIESDPSDKVVLDTTTKCIGDDTNGRTETEIIGEQSGTGSGKQPGTGEQPCTGSGDTANAGTGNTESNR